MKYLATLTLAAMLAATAAQAFDLGPLNQFVKPTDQGNWTVTDEGGSAVFENRATPGDITYIYAAPKPGEEGRREISLNVGVLGGDGYSKAGLLYGFQANPRSYYMFTVSANSTVRLEQRTPDGWQERMSSTIGGLDPKNTTLTIRENGNEITLLVNGEERAGFGSDSMGRGGVGIVAAGIGKYAFGKFSISVGGTAEPETEPSGTAEQSSDDRSWLQPEQAGRTAEASGAPDALPEGVLHIKPVQVIDKHGFEKPIPAASTLIPADWSFDSSVKYPNSPCAREPKLIFDATSPDGNVTVSMLPGFTVGWSSLGNSTQCPFHRALKAEEMLEPVVGRLFKNMRVVEIKRDPAMTAQFERAARRSPQLSEYRDHAIAVVEHDHRGGRQRASVLLFTQHKQVIQPMSIGPPAEATTTTVLPFIYSAPKEEFGKPEHIFALGLIFSGFRPDPAWQARVAPHMRAIAEDDARTADSIRAINRGASSFISSLNQSSRDSAAASDARNHRRALEMLTETQTVQTGSGPLRVPAGHAWQASNGSVFVAQSKTFNPNSVGVSAKRLQPIR